MNRADLLRTLAVQLEWPDLQETTPLADEERWDSLAQVDVIMVLSDQGFAVSTDQLQTSAMIGDVLDLALKDPS